MSRCNCQHCDAYINIPVNWFTMYFYEDLTRCWIFWHMKMNHSFQSTEDNWFTFVLRFIGLMLKFDLACVLIPVKIVLTPFVILDRFLFFDARRDMDFEINIDKDYYLSSLERIDKHIKEKENQK